MTVVWRVTQRCNLSCPFCAYDRRLDWDRAEADPVRVRHFARVLGQYQAATGDPVLVSWMGGEPLHWAPLEALTLELRSEHRLRISATTNGTPLSHPRLRRHVLDHYAELTLSVDGIGRVHEELRGWPGGWDALGAAVRSLRRDRGGSPTPRLRVNVVLMRHTLSAFPDLCRELAGWGVEEITFNQLGGNDRPEFYPAHRLEVASVRWLADHLPAWRMELAERGVRLCGSTAYLDRLDATAEGRKLPVSDCGPGERFLFVNERGLAAPCSFTVRWLGVPLAELDSVEALQALPLRFAAARRGHRPDPCDDCHSTQVFEKFLPGLGGTLPDPASPAPSCG